MNIDLSSLRKNYKKNLSEYSIQKNPFQLFHNWFQKEKLIHKNENLNQEINAMSLSTIGIDGSPDTRIVLLKEYSNKGFVFYTNYLSIKGISIKKFPKVCLSFFWEKTERQVIIKGITYKINKKKSDEYFDKRPRENKIGCWSSKQSSIIPSRKYLINKYKKWDKYFTKKKLTRPFYWGGYIVDPYKMEFWQGSSNRLHDRIVYKLIENKEWIIQILSP
ncbi:pyridoxamine 5'-phosphate oxidase [Blattabacterium cuenoti]|uniref:pyridoxamine 5'-phosphate oxidase n=1 Tax=Blattabacterium cuenoti TaxID=1653831 RepID=UPI00163CC3E9|nr:pyridoxamine 5'-phosphate oxidase [Blattabacterium cuenoti]